MAVFGAPVSHSDDAERAGRAGFRVFEDLAELNEARGLDLAARAAVTTGEAVVRLGGKAGEPLATGSGIEPSASAGRPDHGLRAPGIGKSRVCREVSRFVTSLAGHIGAAKAGFETMWRNAGKVTAWTRWLIFVRLSAARAEIAL